MQFSIYIYHRFYVCFFSADEALRSVVSVAISACGYTLLITEFAHDENVSRKGRVQQCTPAELSSTIMRPRLSYQPSRWFDIYYDLAVGHDGNTNR